MEIGEAHLAWVCLFYSVVVIIDYQSYLRLNIIVLRINNATIKVKKGEVQTARYMHAKETER